MAHPLARFHPVYSEIIRQIGGPVTVHRGRNHADGSPIFRVSHVSRGGDTSFLSLPIMLEESAHAAADVLAQYVGGKVV